MGQRVCPLTLLPVPLLTKSPTIHVVREFRLLQASKVIDRTDLSFLDTRKFQESKLERFFKPDPISFCHFSFHDVTWAPQPKRSCLKKKQEKSRYDRLFELVGTEKDFHPDRGGRNLNLHLPLLTRIIRIGNIQRSIHCRIQLAFDREPR